MRLPARTSHVVHLSGISIKVKDPNIIGSMSGHVEGSKAFARYRDIDDEIKLDVLKEIE